MADGEVGMKFEVADIEGLQSIDNFLRSAFTQVFGKERTGKFLQIFTRFIQLGEGSPAEIAELEQAFSDKGLNTYFQKHTNNLPQVLKKIGGLGGLKFMVSAGHMQLQVRDLIAQTKTGKAHQASVQATADRIAGEQQQATEKEHREKKAAEVEARNRLIDQFLQKFGVKRTKLLGMYDSKHPERCIIAKETTKEEIQNAHLEGNTLVLEVGEPGKNPRKYRITTEGRVEQFSGGIGKFVKNIK